MGRTMPLDCDRCGNVLDWGDFGPYDGAPSECTCDLPKLGLEILTIRDAFDFYIDYVESDEFQDGWNNACDTIINVLWRGQAKPPAK